jgi:glycosyltransferase involved in cell wall biosynthesis
MNKIHICYLVSSLCNEGPVNVMYNIIQYIDFSKFEVSIITLIPEKKNSRLQEFKQFPIHIHQLAPNTKLSPIKLFQVLKQKVIEINPDELHSHCARSLYLMCFLPKKFKRVYTIHIYPGLQQQIMYGKLKGNIVIALNNFFTKRCDLPIGCAESVGELYKQYKGWNILSIPNGSSLPIWQYNEQEKQTLKKELGLKENIKYFIFIGRFSKEKNPDILVEAFNKITSNNIGIIMLGQGPMWDELNKIKNRNIIMPGFTTRVYDYLKASDYYISASDVEGLANTILESMSVGLPMLLSDIPSHQEVLANIRDTQTGYIINHKNPQDIIHKIEKIINLDSNTIRNCIQNLYLQKYTAQIMSESYQQAYIQLLKQ